MVNAACSKRCICKIMLGDNISGYDLIKKIREKDSKVPVIFTSARDQDLDKIKV